LISFNSQAKGITFTENGERKFKAHLTEELPTKDNLSIQGRKVIYNKIFTDVQYNLIPVSSYDDIKRVTLKSFGADGKKLDNKYYEKEWKILIQTRQGHHLYILHTIQCNQRIFNLLFGVIKV
jgi:hypothetical protein